MSRPRQKGRRNWPDYLNAKKKPNGLFYFWRHPDTGKEYGLGYDFQEAASQAREVNLALAQEKANAAARLIDRIADKDKETMSAWLDKFEAILEKRKGRKGAERSANTIAQNKHYLKVLRGHFQEKLTAKITTKECAELLESYVNQGKQTAAYQLRSFMIDCFAEAERAGWIKRGTNPAEITRVEKPQVKRKRLTLEQLNEILEEAKKSYEPWLETAIYLGVLTGHRIGDVCNMKFSDVFDDGLDGEEYLHVVPDKSQGNQRIMIPISLGLPEIGLTIGDVIKQAKKRGIVGAKYIVHHIKEHPKAPRGSGVVRQTVSGYFTDIVRALWGNPEDLADPKNENLPTFHELRSLAKRLYSAHGVDTKALLGHESDEAAAIYADPRGGWVTVAIPEKLAK